MSVLWVFLGGALGGVLRYLLGAWWPAPTDGRFAPGLLAANLLGSVLLGMVAGFAVEAGYLLLGTGLCGGLTTFSSFAVECVRVWRAGHRLAAVVQAAVMVGSGVAAAAAGLWFGGLPG